MTTWRRWLLISALALLLTGYLIPWGIYWYGLSLIDEYPESVSEAMSPDDFRAEWARFGGVGEPKLKSLTPWAYLLCYTDFERCAANDRKYGVLHADKLALAHLAFRDSQSRKPENLGLKRAALTIWITRNWRIEEVLTTLRIDYGETYR